MDWIWLSFVYGVALAMDCLALSITDGLCYEGISKKKYFFIAGVFAFGQFIFPLIGHLIGYLGESVSWFDDYDHWIAFALLVFIGGKMLFEGIRGIVKPEESKPMVFTYHDVLFQGVADSIDALVVGVTISLNIHSTYDWQNYVGFLIIGFMTFVISLIGLFAGKQISKLLHGKYEISEIIGGIILVALGVVAVVDSYI